jgi:hypothetical protein
MYVAFYFSRRQEVAMPLLRERPVHPLGGGTGSPVSQTPSQELTPMGPFFVTVPVMVSDYPEDGGCRFCVIEGDVETHECLSDARRAAGHRYVLEDADLVLVFLEAHESGFHYVGSVGWRQSTGQHDFPGSMEACESVISEVKSKLSAMLEQRVSIRS